MLGPGGDEGSDLRLPHAIEAGGGILPADASDIHYPTRNGTRVDVVVERSTPYHDAFRRPARAVVTSAS